MVGQGRRVLLVDDDPQILNATCRTLTQNGFAVDVALSPTSALELSRNNRYDVIAADYHMPEQTGAELLSELRPLAGAAQFILLTGDRGVDPATLQCALSSCLYKPWSREALLRVFSGGSPEEGESAIAERPLLLVEADPIEQTWLRILLRKAGLSEGAHRFASSIEEALELVARGGYCAALLSRALPQPSPEHALSRLKRADPSLPIIEIHDAHAAAGPASHRGASNRIIRGQTDGAEFALVLRHAVEAKRADEALKHAVRHDATTGLMNRRAFLAQLERTVAESHRAAGHSVLFLLDIIDFKRFNYELGLQAGDRFLAACAMALAKFVGESGAGARLGGDDFACLLTDVDPDRGPAELAMQLRLLATTELLDVASGFRASIAVGAVVLGPQYADVNRALRAAESALRNAKETDRGSSVYGEDLRRRDARRDELEADLKGALSRDELALHYQPLYGFSAGRIERVEALLRWTRPSGERVSPAEFIPLLERSGQIVEVGGWVLAEACRQTQLWRQSGHPELTLAVNLSPRQFGDQQLAHKVSRTLAATGLPARALELEVTESILIDDVGAAGEQLRELKNEHGVSLALDDFGTGYSSLTYLRRFAFDTLKIDRSFVSDCDQTPAGERVCAAIIQLGHAFGMRVVAEGIERPHHLQVLRRYGCDLAQGYLLHRPVAPQDVCFEDYRPDDSEPPSAAEA